MGPNGTLYRDGRTRFVELVRDADPTTPVPACPRWTVKDVFSHVAGIPADILAGRVEGVATEPWTQAQVDARQSQSIADIAAEWEQNGAQVDEMVDSFGPTGAQLLFDLTTHELDVRAALGTPMPDDLEVYDVALDFVMANLLADVPLRFVAGDRIWSGADVPVATLTISKRELLRAVAGRRTKEQIVAMDWVGDPSHLLDVFARGPFSFPEKAIAE